MRKPDLKKYKELDLAYNNKFSFYKYNDINKFKRNSIVSRYNNLDDFQRDLNKFNSLEYWKEHTNEKKTRIKNYSEALYHELQEINLVNKWIFHFLK